ncbi:hypothetical protein HKX48_001123 [Thoreauomyces humboldtii]|nr:hypothetical protein HKX48_001123 [Thoreauomyces humboldtii]
MGAKPEKSFTLRLHTFGEKLKDLVDAEEWFLKSVPGVTEVAWGPPTIATDAAQAGDPLAAVPVALSTPVHHPTSIASLEARSHLTALILRRKAYHHGRLKFCFAALPFSSLFMILPGPNVPLAWNLFRLYSHWRALQGAHTLTKLHEADLLVYTPDKDLDKHLDGWRKLEDDPKGEYIPDDVVRKLIEDQVVGKTFKGEVERIVKQLDKMTKKTGMQAIVLGNLNKDA